VGIRTTVLGIGNLLLGDEGIGIHAVEALRERHSFPGDVRLIDGGTKGLDLLPFIEETDSLLIIDAVDFKAEPGTVRVIEGENIKVFLDLKFSVHQIGVPDLLFAAALTDNIPERMCLVGIQPDIIEAGLEPSRKLGENFQLLLDAVIEKLNSWGVEVKEKTDVSGNTFKDNPY
jgi:hydrogenase maturation protease